MTRGRSDVPERGEAGPNVAVGLPTLQAMLDQLVQGCAIFDAAHRLAAWNWKLQQLLRLSDAELAGAPTFERFIRRQAERGDFGTAAESVEAAVREHLDALETTYLAERMLSDGRIVECRRNPLPDAG